MTIEKTSNVLGIQIFSDFDGTITLADTGVIILDHCAGQERRRQMDLDVLNGKLSFRELCTTLWGTVTLNWDQATELIKDVPIDSHFCECLRFCREHEIPFTVLSCGLQKMIEWKLEREVSDAMDGLQVMANDVDYNPVGWSCFFRDDSPHGFDKSRPIREARKAAQEKGEPFLAIFLGDGVSDMCAAMEADILFVRRGRDLETYCKREGIKHIPFDTFEAVILEIKRLLQAHQPQQ